MKLDAKNVMLSAAGMMLLFTSCLTIKQKQIVDPPYVPPKVEGADAGETEKLAKIYFSKDNVPVIDGVFDEWKGLEGVHSRKMVYGGLFNPVNTDGFFVVRTDGVNLYLYADVTDDDPETNAYPAAQAWRGDSIEFFFGTDTSAHKFYKNTDKRVRIIPKSKDNKFKFDLSINDVSTVSSAIKAAIVFSDKGCQIEAVIPLSALNTAGLKLKQNVRCDFQVNDGDNGKERSRLMHWNSPKDNTYLDASSWGPGKVVALPAENGGTK